MPTELEELVGFIGSPNPQIRLVATENLIPYSLSDPALFKTEDLKPVKNLAILVQDHPKIAEHATTILINLSDDKEVLETLATNEKYLEILFGRLVKPDEPNANLFSMLLANLAKSDKFKDILKKKQPAPSELESDDTILNHLMDLWVKGQEGSYNKAANYDYLAYVLADLSKHSDIRQFFLTEQAYDGLIPITKVKVFTEHKSDIRRRGAASILKNIAFEVNSHPSLLSADEVNVLPYILLPIMGNEEYDLDEALEMVPEVQLLPPDKKRDSDATIIQTHVETLTLLTTTREGRDMMRKFKVYPIIRETHSRVNHEGVREACDRLVQVLMRDEEGEGQDEQAKLQSRIQEIEDEEEQLVEV